MRTALLPPSSMIIHCDLYNQTSLVLSSIQCLMRMKEPPKNLNLLGKVSILIPDQALIGLETGVGYLGTLTPSPCLTKPSVGPLRESLPRPNHQGTLARPGGIPLSLSRNMESMSTGRPFSRSWTRLRQGEQRFWNLSWIRGRDETLASIGQQNISELMMEKSGSSQSDALLKTHLTPPMMAHQGPVSLKMVRPTPGQGRMGHMLPIRSIRTQLWHQR